MKTDTQREITESIIAEVVNETLPSNEQMKTVRILRKVIPEHFATELTKAREDERKKVAGELNGTLIEDLPVFEREIRKEERARLREKVERQTVYMRSKFLLHAPDCCEPVPKSIGVEEEPLFGMILREDLLTIISE